jgi:hypothetical protein
VDVPVIAVFEKLEHSVIDGEMGWRLDFGIEFSKGGGEVAMDFAVWVFGDVSDDFGRKHRTIVTVSKK